LLTGNRDAGVVVFHLGAWFVNALDLVGALVDICIGIGPLFLSPLSEVWPIVW
jgi:hypothetical protein